MKINTSTTVMQMLAAVRAASKNPTTLPALDSHPEFFVNTTPSPLHQPVKSPARLQRMDGVVTVDLICKNATLANQEIPISAGYLVRADGKKFHLYTNGLN